MSSIFTKIIKGELPCHKIAESKDFFAFLDIKPLKAGHTLIVPKKEVDYIFDLPNELLGQLHIFSKSVAKAIEKAVPCKRIGMSVIGLEVPHAHIHLIPINDVGDMNFDKHKVDISETELADIASAIRSSYTA